MGKFIIKVDGKVISSNAGKAKKLWKLLNLLILNINKIVPIQTIIEALEFDGGSEISSKTVFNLVFRLKSMFSAGDKSAEYITFSNNGYILNADENLWIDIYVMEDYYNRAMDVSCPEDEKIRFLENIAQLYDGEYLLKMFDDFYTITAVHHYEHLFIMAVNTLAELYFSKGLYERMFKICNKAMMLKPVEESVYLWMIKGLRRTGETVRAINLCETYFNILCKEMNIPASDQMQNIYTELKNNTGTAINPKPTNMYKTGNFYNIIFCNFETFNDICRYELNQIERSDNRKVTYGVILSINDKKGGLPSDHLLYKAKEKLYESCVRTIRKSDIFADYSSHQFVLLLTNVKSRNYSIIMERLKKYFYSHCDLKGVFVNYEVDMLTESWLDDISSF